MGVSLFIRVTIECVERATQEALKHSNMRQPQNAYVRWIRVRLFSKKRCLYYYFEIESKNTEAKHFFIFFEITKKNCGK